MGCETLRCVCRECQWAVRLSNVYVESVTVFFDMFMFLCYLIISDSKGPLFYVELNTSPLMCMNSFISFYHTFFICFQNFMVLHVGFISSRCSNRGFRFVHFFHCRNSHHS